jgi:hypothetical protein
LFADVEGRASEEKFIGEYSDGPEVYFLIVFGALKKFRGQIERSAAEGAPQLLLLINCPPKIA